MTEVEKLQNDLDEGVAIIKLAQVEMRRLRDDKSEAQAVARKLFNFLTDFRHKPDWVQEWLAQQWEAHPWLEEDSDGHQEAAP